MRLKCWSDWSLGQQNRFYSIGDFEWLAGGAGEEEEEGGGKRGGSDVHTHTINLAISRLNIKVVRTSMRLLIKGFDIKKVWLLCNLSISPICSALGN